MNRRALLIAVLVPAAVLASWGAWQLRPPEPVNDNVGPERSDYTLDIYHLVAIDKKGVMSFISDGPYLARDLHDQSLDLNHPTFRFPGKDKKGDWTGHSESGWVSAKGDVVKLARTVVLDGPVVPSTDQTHLHTEQMTVYPDPQTAHSDLLVTVNRGPSILIGTGMNANLKTSEYDLLSKVSLHDVPVPKH